MDILEMIKEKVKDPKTLKKLSEKANTDEKTTGKVIDLALPTILKALDRNSDSKEGRESLSNALDKHKSNDTDDINNLLDNFDSKEGSSMLNHILGDKNSKVKNNIANQSDTDESTVSTILKHIAPIIISMLAKKKMNDNLGSDGISSMLSSLTSKEDNSKIDIAKNMLDSDGDGNIMDDLGDKLGGMFKK